MSDTIDAKGQCLCGAVEIEAKALQKSVGACHCGMCRHWGGGPFLVLQCEGEVEIVGSNQVSVFDSSEWAERGFCNQCGTHLFYRLKQSKQYFLPAGIFDLDDELDFDHQVFIDKKPTYYHFANKTKDMTEEEVFAMFSGT
ncbi:MAG: GFA family protein [Pseudohongiellaceae bacterium]